MNRIKTTLLFAVISLLICRSYAAPRQYSIATINVAPLFSPSQINNSGQIVGFIPESGGTSFIYDSVTKTVLDIGRLASTEGDVVALSINDSGAVVGYQNRGGQRAFLWSAQSGTTWLGTIPGDRYSVATRINNAGQVVGFSSEQNARPTHAFLYSAGAMRSLPLPFPGFASDINDFGVVVGSSYGAPRTAFSWSAMGGLRTFSPVFGDSTEALAINSSGMIVGWTGYYVGPANPWQHAALFDRNGTTDLDTGGHNFSRAVSLNDSGEIVGFDPNRGFLVSQGVMVELGSLLPPDSGWECVLPADINESGFIVGVGRYRGEDFSAFLMSPLPAGDSDGDGVPDGRDECLNTTQGAVVDAQGCSIDQLVPCAGPLTGGTWKNHGHYVSTVAKTAQAFLAAGHITNKEANEIVRAAAQADCGKMNEATVRYVDANSSNPAPPSLQPPPQGKWLK